MDRTSSWEENDEDERKEDEDPSSDSSDGSVSSEEDSDMEVEPPRTPGDDRSVQATEPTNGEVPVVESATHVLEQHQGSPPNGVPSPVSQAEPYNFEEALEIALRQQCVEVDILKCVTLGPPGVGKTQLRRALTGNYEEVTESTPVSTGAEVVIEKCMDSEKTWQKFDLQDGQKALVTSVRKRDFAEVSPDSPHMETRSQRSVRSRKQVSKHLKLVHSIAKGRALCKKLRESREHMMKQLQRTDDSGQKSLHRARIIHLIDSGGQPSFFDVHSTLATSRAAYLQVFNLAEALDFKPKMTYRRSFPTKELSSRFRNIDFIARTLATLHDCKKKFKMDEMIRSVISGHKSKDLPIFLIGTHLDEARSSNEDVSSAIEKELNTFPVWNEVVPNSDLNFHPVSCLAEGREGLAVLQQKISECRGGYPIRLPLSWFFVELMFWAEKASGDGCLKYSELCDICIQDKLLQSKDEFLTMVKLFHILGLFSCPDLDRELHDRLDDFPVFTDPNFLFGQVSKILDIAFRAGLSGSLKYLQDTGMLQEGALGDLGIPTSAGTLDSFHDWLKDCLVMWGLAAVVKKRKGKGKAKKSEQAQELFIPSVLPPRPSARDVGLDVCSLLVAFLDEDDGRSYHIPQGIFSHFIARLVQDKGYLVGPDVYRDLVSFKNVCRERVTYTVRVYEEMDHLAFSLVPESPTKRSSPASYNAIREELLQVLKTVWKSIYRNTPTLTVGFRCPCQREGGSSQGHIAKYMEESRELSCSSKFRDGKSMSASSDQLKWFGILQDRSVVNAGKENLPCISTAMLQPVAANNSSLPLGQPPPPGQNNTPLAGSTERNRSRSSPSSVDPSRSPLERCTQTSAHPADISSGNSSTGQVASDQPDTAAQPLESRALEKYEDRFFKVVDAKEIAPGLHRRNVIPESVMSQIGRCDSGKGAQELLFHHLKQHGNVNSLKTFCEEAINCNGYPNMQSLGREMRDMLEQEGKVASSTPQEKLPSGSPELPHPASMNSSSSRPQLHTSQSQPPRLSPERANTAGTGKQSTTKKGKQSTTKKGAKKRSSSLPDPHSHSLTKWFKPCHSQQNCDSQQLNGGSQTADGQTAGHPLPLNPTYSSSSSSGVFSGGSEEVASVSLSQPDDSPLDTDVPPPPKRSRADSEGSSS